MRADEVTLLRLEERLARGEVPQDSAPELLEAVRHVLGCRYGRGAAKGSSERRGVRSRGKGRKKGTAAMAPRTTLAPNAGWFAIPT